MAARIEAYLKTDHAGVRQKLVEAQEELQKRQKKLERLFQKRIRGEIERTMKKAPQVAGTRLVIQELKGADNEALRQTADWIRSHNGSFAAVLSSVIQGKPQVLVALSGDLVKKGIKAGSLAKEIAQTMGGSGGGRPELALGGGKPGADMAGALQFARQRMTELLEKS